MKNISNIRRTNYFVDGPSFPGWHIVAQFDAYGYRIGITSDGLIKDIAKITNLDVPLSDGSYEILDYGIDWDEIPKEIFSYNSYRGEKWEKILKLTELSSK